MGRKKQKGKMEEKGRMGRKEETEGKEKSRRNIEHPKDSQALAEPIWLIRKIIREGTGFCFIRCLECRSDKRILIVLILFGQLKFGDKKIKSGLSLRLSKKIKLEKSERQIWWGNIGLIIFGNSPSLTHFENQICHKKRQLSLLRVKG